MWSKAYQWFQKGALDSAEDAVSQWDTAAEPAIVTREPRPDMAYTGKNMDKNQQSHDPIGVPFIDVW